MLIWSLTVWEEANGRALKGHRSLRILVSAGSPGGVAGAAFSVESAESTAAVEKQVKKLGGAASSQ